MNKKTTIIIAFLFAAIGIILTGLFGEAASSSDYKWQLIVNSTLKPKR